MAKLDKTKPFGTFFNGNCHYHGQDGRIFDMNTLEEVPMPAPAAPPVLCKLCGQQCKDLPALELHLSRGHGIRPVAPPAVPSSPVTPELPKSQTKGKAKNQDQAK